MKTEWFRGLTTDEAKQERRELVKSARPTLEVLKGLLEKRLKDKADKQSSEALYLNPNWAYLQADSTGAMRELKTLIDLLTIEDRND